MLKKLHAKKERIGEISSHMSEKGFSTELYNEASNLFQKMKKKITPTEELLPFSKMKYHEWAEFKAFKVAKLHREFLANCENFINSGVCISRFSELLSNHRQNLLALNMMYAEIEGKIFIDHKNFYLKGRIAFGVAEGSYEQILDRRRGYIESNIDNCADRCCDFNRIPWKLEKRIFTLEDLLDYKFSTFAKRRGGGHPFTFEGVLLELRERGFFVEPNLEKPFRLREMIFSFREREDCPKNIYNLIPHEQVHWSSMEILRLIFLLEKLFRYLLQQNILSQERYLALEKEYPGTFHCLDLLISGKGRFE